MIKQSLVPLLIAVSIYLSGGSDAFVPFLNAEAVLLVFGGTFLLTWAVYPSIKMFNRAPLQYASRCAIGMGVLTTLFGFDGSHLVSTLECRFGS